MYVKHSKRKDTNFEVLKGKTLAKVSANRGNKDCDGDCITFTTQEGTNFKMYHSQECCEEVYIESIVGDLQDLVGEPILVAEEATNYETPSECSHEYEPDSQTWTFYKLASRKGYVDIRWVGKSNGFYSESVSFIELLD